MAKSVTSLGMGFDDTNGFARVANKILKLGGKRLEKEKDLEGIRAQKLYFFK